MTRIFVTLSIVAVMLLFANMMVGLTGGDYNDVSRNVREKRLALREAEMSKTSDPTQFDESQREYQAAVQQFQPLAKHMTFHRLFGILASLMTLLVNSIGVTYFIGTSRWCKEVVDAYGFDTNYVRRSNRLKRFTFAWALGGMLTVVAIAAFGAAADPGTLRATTAEWVNTHLAVAMGGIAFIAGCLWQQHRNVVANQEIIQHLVTEVAEVRRRNGLDANEPQVAAT